MSGSSPKIVLLSGGVGGAKMAEGFAFSQYADQLSIIGNVADDQEFHGLWISPDIDTLIYTLADQIDKEKGWGLKEETSQVLSQLQKLGSETWMYLGDKDFATHIFRTEQRKNGVRPTEIARQIAKGYGVEIPVILPTDSCIQNRVKTANGWLDFQDYFVKFACQPEILDLSIEGLTEAEATPEALNAISEADLVVIAPSNPLVSIKPILSVPGISEALQSSSAVKIAVSPLVQGETLKGPAGRMMQQAGYRSDAIGIADFYSGMIDGLLVDQLDRELVAGLSTKVGHVLATDTLMFSRSHKVRLAETIVHFYEAVCNRATAPASQNHSSALDIAV